MLRLFFISMLLAGLTSAGICQRSEEPYYAVALHAAPLSLVDPFPRIRMGVDFQQTPSRIYTVDLGFGWSLWNFEDMWKNRDRHYFVYEMRPEVKFLFWRRPNSTSFFATELYYLRARERLEHASYSDVRHTTTTSFSEALYDRQKLGLNLKVGSQGIFLGRIVFEFYYGVGVAYRDIQYLDAKDQVMNPYNPRWFKVHVEQGKTLLLQVPFGLKVGVIFE